jgi:hypothetical protein
MKRTKPEFVDITTSNTKGIGFFRLDIIGESIAVDKSAMQKSIRRSKPDIAVWYATALLLSEHIANVYNRLLIISAEDIGPANNQIFLETWKIYKVYVAARLRACNSWKEMCNDHNIRSDIQNLAASLALAPKSRICDHFCISVLDLLQHGQKIPPGGPVPTAFTLKVGAMLAAKDIKGTVDTIKRLADQSTIEKRKELLLAVAAVQKDQGSKTNIFLAYACCIESIPEPDLIFEPLAIDVDIPDPARQMFIDKKRMKAPYYAYDIHVHGVKCVHDIVDFIKTEEAALTPRGRIVDPYYAYAVAYGAQMRFESE